MANFTVQFSLFTNSHRNLLILYKQSFLHISIVYKQTLFTKCFLINKHFHQMLIYKQSNSCKRFLYISILHRMLICRNHILAASLFLNMIQLLVNDPLCSFDAVASHNNEEIRLFINNQFARVNNAYMQRRGCLFINKQLPLVCGTFCGLEVGRYAQFICAVPTTLHVTSPPALRR